MNIAARITRTNLRTIILAAILLVPLSVVALSSHSIFAAAGACTAPSTDYGSVTTSVAIPATGTYRVWTRLAAPSTTVNTYMLQIDGNSCYTIGGSTVPVFTAAQDSANTRFAANSTNWIAKTSTGTFVDVALTAGSHALKLIGTGDGVVVDRLIFTQDTSCVPDGVNTSTLDPGDNCANPPDKTPPTVSITSPANNSTITATTTVTATASDDVAIAKVEFYVDGTLKATDTASPYTFVPGALSLGSHQIVAKAYDTAMNPDLTPDGPNVTTSTTLVVNVTDTSAPTISAVASSAINQTGATITWTTNEAADSQVEYGTSTSYGTSTALNNTNVTSHSVSLTGLTAGTTYHYRVKSADAANNLTNSPDATFTTSQAVDGTAPNVSITAPASNATVAGATVTVSATATDNVAVAGVQFKLNGANIGAEDTTAPYSITWSTTALTNGVYTLTAVARDTSGLTKTSTGVPVTVSNTVITYLATDINQDRITDIHDFGLLKAAFNESGPAGSLGRVDINNDGYVDIHDFGLLKANFNKKT